LTEFSLICRALCFVLQSDSSSGDGAGRVKKPSRRKPRQKARQRDAAADRPRAPAGPAHRMAPPRIHARAGYHWPDLTTLARQTRARAARELDIIARAVPFDAD